MTRILASLIAAASFVLPAAAFADASVADMCAKAEEDNNENAIQICDELAQAKDDVLFLEDMVVQSEQALEQAKSAERPARVHLWEAKEAYRSEASADNFYKVIQAQIALNEVRAQIEEAEADLQSDIQKLEEAYDFVAFLEAELEASF